MEYRIEPIGGRFSNKDIADWHHISEIDFRRAVTGEFSGLDSRCQ